jgi:hypothetical protein
MLTHKLRKKRKQWLNIPKMIWRMRSKEFAGFGALICKHCKINIVFEDTQDDFCNLMRHRVRELFTELENEQQNWTYYEEKDKNKCVTIESM